MYQYFIFLIQLSVIACNSKNVLILNPDRVMNSMQMNIYISYKKKKNLAAAKMPFLFQI